jgi:hypothetical protein
LRQPPLVHRSASTIGLAASHHFYAYETQISLWLAASALYRDIDLFEKAKSSLKEAESLVDTLSRMELRIQSSSGRLFKDQDNFFCDSLASFTSRASTQSLNVEKSQGGWDLSNAQVRRILADIALEVTSV